MAIYLGPDRDVLGMHTLVQGDRCGADPLPALPAMIAHAQRLHTAYLLTFRRHNHQWAGPSQRGQDRGEVDQGAGAPAPGYSFWGRWWRIPTGAMYALLDDHEGDDRRREQRVIGADFTAALKIPGPGLNGFQA